MNPIVFALRHPISVMVAMVGIVVGSILAVNRMKVDIFPVLNLPVLYVAQPYGGMDPAQMEGLLTNYYEYHFLYISGIHHVESKNIQGSALMKLYFHPGTDMAQAMAETVQYVNRAKAFMPTGTVPPFIMRYDTGSVPVGYLVLSSETKSIDEIQDQALFKVRPMFASLPGVSAPPPFGGNARTIVVRVDPDRLRAHNISPDEVIAVLSRGNAISPSGNIYVKDQMPIVPTNALVVESADLGKIPIRPGSNVYLRDLGVIKDAADVPSGHALVNGRRAVYLLATKRADASTLSVVNEIRANLPKMQAQLPADIDVKFVFDQSPYVVRSMWNVGLEGLLGAVLTGLMVLLFLRDWRSVIVVVLNIPLALLGALIALWLTGQTINLMTLGGLALAIGILVDEATVEVENIHVQMARTDSIAWAVRLGNAETAVPRLLAMLCMLAVFLPSLFMQGAAQALFMPLALAVGFAMVTSYFLSSTFVPVMSVWLLRHHHAASTAEGGILGPMRRFHATAVAWVLPLRWPVIGGYLAATAAVLALGGSQLGMEIFPKVDAGQFQLRLRAATGTRFNRTEEITVKALDIIKNKVGPDNFEISVGYVGLIPSSYPINTIHQFMCGPEEAVIRIALKRGTSVAIEQMKEDLRVELPAQLGAWLRERMLAEDFSTEQIDQRIRDIKLSFEPADIVNQVMSFGASTPIEVVVSGPKFTENRAFAAKVKAEMDLIDSLRDLQYVQPLDYPTIDVTIDREMAGLSGTTADDVARSMVAATSSSRFVLPNFWRAPESGIGYLVQVEFPLDRMTSAKEVGLIPLRHQAPGQLLLRDVARIEPGKMPGEIDRYNMRRYVSLMANIEGEDLGRVAAKIAQAIRDAGEAPRGVTVDVRGQIEPMNQIFQGLFVGLGLTILAIFLLLTAYFQSVRLALTVMATAPAVLAGVTLMLLATGTTLNIQSFMGTIMAIGVATANAILLVTFADKLRRRGADPLRAALEGAQQRLRPILMTSFAMIAGMLPMALALGEAGQQVAPLGRAVIGGLLSATLTTLLILPAIFAVAQGRASVASVSLDPEDPESALHSAAPAAFSPARSASEA
jgi:multidrug efflux pump subunit AcrB